MSLKVQTSNVTNKTDPKSINSRVFIGNLNTAVVSKSEVESIFSTYGRVLGCSVHKGYAFVQYANERHARGAVFAENGRVLGGQMLDINMAGEPKPGRDKTSKRAASSLYSSYDYEHLRDDLFDRLMQCRGQVSPDAWMVPVKRPRAAPPLVHQLTSLPVRLLPRDPGGKHARVRGAQLRAIKSQLTQIKDHIDALLGRLERFAEDSRISRTETRAWPQRHGEEDEARRAAESGPDVGADGGPPEEAGEEEEVPSDDRESGRLPSEMDIIHT